MELWVQLVTVGGSLFVSNFGSAPNYTIIFGSANCPYAVGGTQSVLGKIPTSYQPYIQTVHRDFMMAQATHRLLPDGSMVLTGVIPFEPGYIIINCFDCARYPDVDCEALGYTANEDLITANSANTAALPPIPTDQVVIINVNIPLGNSEVEISNPKIAQFDPCKTIWNFQVFDDLGLQYLPRRLFDIVRSGSMAWPGTVIAPQGILVIIDGSGPHYGQIVVDTLVIDAHSGSPPPAIYGYNTPSQKLICETTNKCWPLDNQLVPPNVTSKADYTPPAILNFAPQTYTASKTQSTTASITSTQTAITTTTVELLSEETLTDIETEYVTLTQTLYVTSVEYTTVTSTTGTTTIDTTYTSSNTVIELSVSIEATVTSLETATSTEIISHTITVPTGTVTVSIDPPLGVTYVSSTSLPFP